MITIIETILIAIESDKLPSETIAKPIIENDGTIAAIPYHLQQLSEVLNTCTTAQQKHLCQKQKK